MNAKRGLHKKVDSGHLSDLAISVRTPFQPMRVDNGHLSETTHCQREDPLPFLYSLESDDGEDLRRVRVNDKGSCPQLAGVEIQGVPAQGIIDSGADISIMVESCSSK